MAGPVERDTEAVVPAQRTAPRAPPGPSVAARRSRSWRLTALGLGLWGAAFVSAAALVGIPTRRSTVVVWALLAVLASRLGDLRSAVRSMVVDFLPVFAALAVYDRLRGSADDLSSVAHVDPHLRFDRALGLGRTPTERLQDWLHSPGPPAWYDQATWAIHLSHFLVSTTLLVVLWRLGSRLFRPLLVGLLVLSYAALATYWAYPAVPPWMASDQGHLGEVVRVVHAVWEDAGVDRAPKLLSGEGAGSGESPFSDPVAALPSLHAAIPLLLTLTLRGIDRRLTAALGAYTLAMGVALVYGGEHYVFDVLLGWGYAYAAWAVTDRGLPGRAWRAARRLVRRRPPVRDLLRSPLSFAAAAVALRLPGLSAPAWPDEAGYLLVAAHARPHGPFLYGDLWVDRPPLLVAFFRVADVLGGLLAARLLALVVVVVVVLAAADAGRTLGGSRGASWAAAVAAALSASPLLGATPVNGELLGAPFVLLACATGLRALQHPAAARTAWRLAGAGALGAGALLVKQNLADALVLLAVTVVALAVRRELAARRAAVLLAAVCAGAAVPLVLSVVWAVGWGSSAGVLWDTVIGFRLAATEVLAGHSTAPVRRAGLLGVAAVATGIVPLLALCCVAAARGGSAVRSAATAGVLAMAVTAAGSMALGGSFWRHYLVQLLPATALAGALLATTGRAVQRAAGGAVVLVVVSATASVAWAAPRHAPADCRTSVAAQQAVREWLQPRIRPDDTAVSVYGVSTALLSTGVEPASPYLWSLAVRTLDPRLDQLLDAVSGPDRATWVVRTLPLHSWGLDSDRRLERQLSGAYRPVAEVCGTRVLLRADLARPPAARGAS